MISIKLAFGRAASDDPGVDAFWLLFFAIAILDDAQRRDDKRRKKRKPKPPAGPRP